MVVAQCSDEFLCSVATILGSSSAAHKAIEERDRRRATGEDATILWDRDRGTLIVGPLPAAVDSGEE